MKYTITHTLIANLLALLICAVIIVGCEEEALLDSQDNTPVEIPGALSATHFPTADGCSWKYVSPDDGYSYTVKIDGARNIGGTTARIMESDSDIPVDSMSLLYGFPVWNSFFTKDLDSYTEHAFELWLDYIASPYFQRNLPKRVVWSFPLHVGKEWLVSESRVPPEITYTRKVVSDKGVLTVPAGTFKDVYYIEEYVFIADFSSGEESPDKYWVAPDVGIIKYEYLDFISNTTITYELSEFTKGR